MIRSLTLLFASMSAFAADPATDSAAQTPPSVDAPAEPATPTASEPAATEPAATEPTATEPSPTEPTVARVPHAEPFYVAVVVGLSSYATLDDEVELDFARSDAATVADALKDLAHYDYVFLLTDREATSERIIDTLKVKAAQFTGPDDVLLLYFVGHGLGSELGAPTLLAYDATLGDDPVGRFDVVEFATDIATWTRAGTTVIVTDAIHRNQLEGVPFHGPSASQWPGVGPNTFILSSSRTDQAAKDGAFGVAFADAIAGGADADADGRIQAKELYDYLDKRFIGADQQPEAAGAVTPDLKIARGVTPGTTAVGSKNDVPIVQKDYEVYAAKFVFRDGAGQTVACNNAPVKTCDPSCYVRNFQAGTCTITAVVDGETFRGKTLALTPGKYDCGLRSDKTISCHPPELPVTQKP